ncbi:DNA polymerase [Aestuariivirga sp.]|uniref:DNA polymerase n=1 Tax=Aestuariivirga sp. TaxID=2650926 RepID=UPI0039E45AC9
MAYEGPLSDPSRSSSLRVHGSLSPFAGREVVYDIEGDGLLDFPEGHEKKLTKLHCLSVVDPESGEDWFYPPAQLEEGLRHLEQASVAVGHHVLGYDDPAIRYIYPWFKSPKQIDTLVLAKMVWPVDLLEQPDFRRFRAGLLPGQLIKRHSIEAWGYRLGIHKVGTDITDWKTYTDYMGERCVSDTKVNAALWNLIKKRMAELPDAWNEAVVGVEMKLKQILTQQESFGWPFDHMKGIALVRDLKNANEELEDQLVSIFGEWWEPQDDPATGTAPARATQVKMTGLPDIIIPRISEKTGKELKPYIGPPLAEYSPDAPFVGIKRVRFNPSSREHLGKRLQEVFGWKPLVFGGRGGAVAKVDEATLEEIPKEVLPETVRTLIMNYFVVSKTLGALQKGKNSWLNAYREGTQAIHGRVDQNGTITHRATHSNPNLGQVPAVLVKETKNDEGKVIKKEPLKGIDGRFGWEARQLFITLRNWALTGTDAASLELKCLGHHLAPFDGGRFAELMSDPAADPHTENSKITGLSRADTKTVTYAFLYGAGPLKIGIGVGFEESERATLLASRELKSYLQFMEKLAKETRTEFIKPDETTCCYIAKGQMVKQRFMNGIAGLKDFRKHVSELAQNQGYLIGLDGRKIVTRKAHASVNSLLQGDGAIICKHWDVELHEILTKKGLKHGTDFRQHGWIHDELQVGHRTELTEIIGPAAAEAMEIVGKRLGFIGRLATDFKVGTSWATTH